MSYENKLWVGVTLIIVFLSVVTGFAGYSVRYLVGDSVTAKLFVYLIAILGFKFWYSVGVEVAEDMIERKK